MAKIKKERVGLFRSRRFWPYALPAVVTRLVTAGTQGYPRGERTPLVVANITGYLAAISSLSYAVNYAITDFMLFQPLIYGNIVSAVSTALVPQFHRFGRVAGILWLTVMVFSTMYYFTSLLGRDSGIQLNYIGAAAVAFIAIGIRRLWLVLAIVGVAAGMHLSLWFSYPPGKAKLVTPQAFLDLTYIFSIVSVTAIIFVVIYYTFTLVRDAQARSDQLLLNILPEAIAERLKAAPEKTIAERHDEATVLFADLVGFTNLSAALGPQRIVELLDDLFSAFDAIASRLGVEKIKTIGDAYMVVAGVPDPRRDHAAAMAELALGMIKAATEVSRRQGHELQVRVGMASGPVLAGVIGRSKFAYDVWGETVNLAARLEANGVAGQILVNTEIRHAIGNEYVLEPGGLLDLKGIGLTQAWFLRGRQGPGSGNE